MSESTNFHRDALDDLHIAIESAKATIKYGNLVDAMEAEVELEHLYWASSMHESDYDNACRDEVESQDQWY